MSDAKNLVIVTAATFQKEVEHFSLPVLVDFFAEWCGPCRMMAPLFQELAPEYEGKCRFAKLNVDESSDIAARFQVMSIPTLVLLSNGKEVDRIIGFSNKVELKAKIDDILTKV